MQSALPTVSLNSLNLPQSNPQPECNHMPRDHGGPQKRRDPKDQNLGPVSIGRCETDWSSVLMMHLVDFLIPPLAMQKSMDPIVCVVLHKEINPQLQCNFPH